MRLLADGKLQVHSGSASLGTTATAIPFGAWLRIGFYLDGGQARLRVYGDRFTTSTILALQPTFAAGSYDTVRFSNVPTTGTSLADIDFAWPQIDTADPGPRKYVKATSDATTGIVPKAVNVAVSTENITGTPAFSVDWGDGSTSGPQASPAFSHTFTQPGTHKITPTVTVASSTIGGNPVAVRLPRLVRYRRVGDEIRYTRPGRRKGNAIEWLAPAP